MPVIRGHLTQDNLGTDIRMVMCVAPWDAALALIVSGGSALVAPKAFWSAGVWNFAWRDLLLPLIVTSCMVLLAAALFYPETRKAEKLIVSCLTDGWGDLGRSSR